MRYFNGVTFKYFLKTLLKCDWEENPKYVLITGIGLLVYLSKFLDSLILNFKIYSLKVIPVSFFILENSELLLMYNEEHMFSDLIASDRWLIIYLFKLIKKGEYNSIYGLIKVSWKKNNNKLTFIIVVPANTKANFIYKDKKTTLLAGNYTLTDL